MCSDRNNRYSLDYDPGFEQLIGSISKISIETNPAPYNEEARQSLSMVELCNSCPSILKGIDNRLVEFDLSGYESMDDDNGDSETSDEMVDLNATYSMKFLGRRKKVTMLTALGESGFDENSEETMQVQTQLSEVEHISKQSDIVYELDNSPHTPANKGPLRPERSFRLCNVSNLSQTFTCETPPKGHSGYCH